MKCARCFFSDQSVRDETCQRCSRNFTRRELLEVIALGLMYLLICRFSAYIFTGDFFNKPLKGGFFFPVDFREIFTFPVNFAEHPLHIFLVGWIFALVILVPLLVALFYGAIPGVIVAFVGAYHVVVPFFVLLVMLGALIAGTRVRNLLHLETSVFCASVPPLVYLFSISFAGVQKVGIVAWLPWLVTVVFIIATVPTVMWYARQRDYKATFLLTMTGTQIGIVLVLFYATIGFSKVEYEFVRRDYWAGSPRFRIVLDSNMGDSDAQRREQAEELFEIRRKRAIEEFTSFIDAFPRSEEASRALFERAELRNMKPYFTEATPNQLRPYTDRISLEAVNDDYERILATFGGTPAAVEARLKIARYYMQHAMPAKARQFLRDNVVDPYATLLRHYRPSTRRPLGHPWREHRLDENQRLHLMYEVLQQGRADLELLEENRDYHDIPLMLFCQLDPRRPGYVQELRSVILRWFDDSKLADNVKLAIIEAKPHSAQEIETLLAEYPRGDVAPRMLLELAAIYRQHGNEDEARRRLQRLLKEFPKSLQAHEAQVMLKELEPGPAEDEKVEEESGS